MGNYRAAIEARKLPETADNLKYFIITEHTLIQHEMQTAFQKIYQKQDNINTSPDALTNFQNKHRSTKRIK